MIYWRDTMKILNGILAVTVLLTGMLGCGRRVIIRKSYLLENPRLFAPADLSVPQPLPFSVDVRDFQVGRAFDQTRIAARSGSNELDYYFYHHWAVRPSMALADMVHELVDGAGFFQRCTRGYSYRPDFIITGQVMRLERLLGGGGADAAHLAVVFELIDVASEQQVVRHEFDRTTNLERDGSMNAFANAVSRMVSGETKLFIEKIVAHFEQKQQ
jgi:ABC-type uncharacterized transport system auxiliary subunit